jgi:hypothetical protein
MSIEYDYDEGFYITKTVTKNDFEYEIYLLKQENLKLKNDIEFLKNQNNNDFIISITKKNLNKDDMLFEERFENTILYIKSLISSEYFIKNHMIEIDNQYEYLIDTLFHNDSDESQNYTSTYLNRRNLCISRKIESLDNLPGPKYFLIKSDQFILKKYTDKNYYQILL